MSDAEDRKDEKLEEVAEEMESEAEDRDDARRAADQNELGDLNQGMQTGTHSTEKLGVNWGPSYRVKRKAKAAPRDSASKGKK